MSELIGHMPFVGVSIELRGLLCTRCGCLGEIDDLALLGDPRLGSSSFLFAELQAAARESMPIFPIVSP